MDGAIGPKSRRFLVSICSESNQPLRLCARGCRPRGASPLPQAPGVSGRAFQPPYLPRPQARKVTGTPGGEMWSTGDPDDWVRSRMKHRFWSHQMFHGQTTWSTSPLINFLIRKHSHRDADTHVTAPMPGLHSQCSTEMIYLFIYSHLVHVAVHRVFSSLVGDRFLSLQSKKIGTKK